MASHLSWYVKDKKVMLFTKLSFNSSCFILYIFTHATIRRFEGNGPEIRLEPEGALCIISILSTSTGTSTSMKYVCRYRIENINISLG